MTNLIVQNGRWSVRASDDSQALDLLALTAIVIHGQDHTCASWAGGRIVETLALQPENKDLLLPVRRWLDRLSDLSSTEPRLLLGYDSDGDLGLWYLTEESAHGFRPPFEPVRCLCIASGSQRPLKNPRLWFLPPQKLERLTVSVTKFRCDVGCPPLEMERNFWMDTPTMPPSDSDEITTRTDWGETALLLHSDPTLRCTVERVRLRPTKRHEDRVEIESPSRELCRRLRHQPLCTLLFGTDLDPSTANGAWERAVAVRVCDSSVEIRRGKYEG